MLDSSGLAPYRTVHTVAVALLATVCASLIHAGVHWLQPESAHATRLSMTPILPFLAASLFAGTRAKFRHAPEAFLWLNSIILSAIGVGARVGHAILSDGHFAHHIYVGISWPFLAVITFQFGLASALFFGLGFGSWRLSKRVGVNPHHPD